MDRRYRVRIVSGIWCTIAGLLIAYLTPLAPLVAPVFDSSDFASTTEQLRSLRQAAMIAAMIGFGLALVSGLYVITQWSLWFIRSARSD
jgi:hypothetical protein